MKYYKATFTITEKGGNKPADENIMQAARDILCAVAAEAGFESFEEQDTGVCGYVQRNIFDAAALDSCLQAFPLQDMRVGYTLTEAEDKDWNLTWEQQGFESIVIDDRCIIHDTLHPSDNAPMGTLDITIDARQAFGTGTHATTKMIVAELLNTDLKGMSVLDCGCGTGILSIVASKSGAETVVGYDIDEWSVENTRHNCAINNVANVAVVEGNADVIPSLNKNFNIVLANINRNILLADMSTFHSAMTGGATLILSGFYTEDAPLLREKAESLALDFVKSVKNADWCMMVFKKP